MRIGLIPLDERPANTRYPALVAAIAGATLLLPPARLLSALRRPADTAALAAWLAEVARGLDGLIVSCEQFGYGSLIASRSSDEPATSVLTRLEALRQVRQARPKLPIYGFSLVTRVSKFNDATEEAHYWGDYGSQLYQLSQLLDRCEQGHPLGHELAALEPAIPAAVRGDFLRRRLRNHTVNLALLGLLADGVFDLLVLSSDDTSPYGLPTREKGWLEGWGGWLGLSESGGSAPQRQETGDKRQEILSAGTILPRVSGRLSRVSVPGRVLTYPGADEVGCVLVARLLNQAAGVVPTITASYAPAEGAAITAAFEDGPVHTTVERQVRAVGAQLVAAGGTIWLGVNAPLARAAEWEPQFAEDEHTTRQGALAALVASAAQRQAGGQAVALADVAYPNGADPALLELLQTQVNLPGLAAYGGWNTAGNTIGTVLAQACAAQCIQDAAGQAAHQQLLLHRLLEDWGYQQRVRREIRGWLWRQHGTSEPTPALLGETTARIAARLNEVLATLPGFAGRYQIVAGSVRLPWGRTFEVDFELQPVAGGV